MFNNKPSQPAFTELHLTIETLEHCEIHSKLSLFRYC